MRTAAKWSVHEGAGGSNGADAAALFRLSSRDPQSSEASWLYRCGSQHFCSCRGRPGTPSPYAAGIHLPQPNRMRPASPRFSGGLPRSPSSLDDEKSIRSALALSNPLKEHDFLRITSRSSGNTWFLLSPRPPRSLKHEFIARMRQVNGGSQELICAAIRGKSRRLYRARLVALKGSGCTRGH